MIRPTRSTGAAVAWLTLQAVVFGAMAALLGIVANAMFLNAYGSAWLPVTYIASAAAGVAVSGTIARLAQRFDLIAIALVVLGAAAVGLLVSWIVARQDAPWVSAPVLVLFPILIQLGFVFIGGQAGRLLDIAGIKASFPRIMAGFPVGAVVGSLLAGQLVSWLGTTEDLLLATAVAQAMFASLVLVTGLRYAGHLSYRRPGQTAAGARPRESTPTPPLPRPPLRQLLGGFVALILGYQVLSALGSQLADFLVYDRAVVQYPNAADLARFLAVYTAAMNAVSIVFLVAIAGPLLRRFGLKLGIAANPLVVTVFAIGMVAALAVGGGASLLLLMTVSAARIADIALTDGTTRTSINATYQVLPEHSRLPVQTAVEGIGVPLAIGLSGVLILVIHVLPLALLATIAATAVVCAGWSWAATLLYRAYGPALVDSLRRGPLLVPAADLGATLEEEALARRLLSGEDEHERRLGLDLLLTMSSPTRQMELLRLADDRRPEVRVSALAALAGGGDEGARGRLATEVGAMLADDGSTAARLRAAQLLPPLGARERAAFSSLLEDADPAVRSAALEGVQEGDDAALGPALAALAVIELADAATGAIGRLGDAVVPSLAERLATVGSSAPASTIRLVRAVATPSAARDAVLARHLVAPDRELAVVVAERLVASDPASPAIATGLDDALDDSVSHAVRILDVLALVETHTRELGRELPLHRALEEELDLVRRHVRAIVLVRHGSARIGPVLLELGSGGPRQPLAREAVEVLLRRAEAAAVGALLEPELSVPERIARLPASPLDEPGEILDVLGDLAVDADRRWRSRWLAACAIHAAIALDVLDRIDIAAAGANGGPMVDELVATQPAAR